jgi:hypothetical protein
MNACVSGTHCIARRAPFKHLTSNNKLFKLRVTAVCDKIFLKINKQTVKKRCTFSPTALCDIS